MHVHFRVIRKKSMHVLACITYMYAHKCSWPVVFYRNSFNPSCCMNVAGILNSLILTAFCFGKHFYEFIFVNPFPQIMKIFSLIDVGYIFFNIWTGSMWRVRVTESEYPLSMQSVIDHPWNDLTKHLVSHPGFLLLANNMAGCVFFPT